MYIRCPQKREKLQDTFSTNEQNNKPTEFPHTKKKKWLRNLYIQYGMTDNGHQDIRVKKQEYNHVVKVGMGWQK